ncbi:hypothetical protein EIP86_001982 [Pleurotus ostreatoroseus]|nr:hypothetical protein EIP86_001982 [Pleurotus ostreatoroseus]
MYAKIASVAAIAAVALSANAFYLDACIINCSAAAASAAGCSSYADLGCVCTSSDFQAAAGACINATCPSGDWAASLELQQLECGTLVAHLTSGKSF